MLVCAGGWLVVPGDVGSNWSSGAGGGADVVAVAAVACAVVVCTFGVVVGRGLVSGLVSRPALLGAWAARARLDVWPGLVLVVHRPGEPSEGGDRVGALLRAVRRTAADGKTTGDRRRNRAGPHAHQRCRVDRAVVLPAQTARWSCLVTWARTGPEAPAATWMSSWSWPAPEAVGPGPSSAGAGRRGDGWRHHRRRRHLRRVRTRLVGLRILVTVMCGGTQPCYRRQRVGALLDAVGRAPADGEASGDRRHYRSRACARERSPVDRR